MDSETIKVNYLPTHVMKALKKKALKNNSSFYSFMGDYYLLKELFSSIPIINNTDDFYKWLKGEGRESEFCEWFSSSVLQTIYYICDNEKEYHRISANFASYFLGFINSYKISDNPIIFSPSKNLIQKLMHTDISKININDIKVPFDSFFIALPDVFCIGYSDIIDTASFDMINVVKHCYDTRTQFCVHRINNGPRMNGNPLMVWPGINSEIETESLINIKNIDLMKNLIINLLIYISSNNNSTQKSDGIVKLNIGISNKKRRQKKFNLYDNYVIGSNVQISKQEKKIYSGQLNGRSISCSFIVRGHWRNQACGKGLMDHKLIWIEPHIKGLGLSKRINGHNYVVQ